MQFPGGEIGWLPHTAVRIEETTEQKSLQILGGTP
jgi:hypothetical protein